MNSSDDSPWPGPRGLAPDWWHLTQSLHHPRVQVTDVGEAGDGAGVDRGEVGRLELWPGLAHWKYWHRWVMQRRNGNNKFYPRVILVHHQGCGGFFLLYLPRSRKTISSSLRMISVSGWLSPSISRKSIIFDVSSKQAWFSSAINHIRYFCGNPLE